MAYSDYGAFVYLNGKRMEEFEDCKCSYSGYLTHGLIHDRDIDVVCYKQGLPNIYYKGERINYYNENKIDFFNFRPFHYEFNGYEFYFCNEDKPYVVEMKTPNVICGDANMIIGMEQDFSVKTCKKEIKNK